MGSPTIFLIAGPNGAGKTTFARQFLSVVHPALAFLNADEIQGELAEFSHPVRAGRELLRRMSEYEALGQEFAVETTLSSMMYARRISKWHASGFRIVLHFIELPSADYAVQRVSRRTAAGGHPIAEDDIRRRFERGRRLFEEPYKGLVDQWYHWQSDDGGLSLVELGRND